MEHFIRLYDNAIDAQTCDDIVALFEKDESKRPGVTMSGNVTPNKISIDLDIRANDDWAKYDHILSQSMSKCLKEYFNEFKDYFKAVSSIGDSGYKIMKYEANVGKFNLHTDVNGLKSSHRFLAGIWYLNDVEEGGETYFVSQDYAIKPVKGRFALFPATFTHLHQGRVATSDKYVINTFATYTA